MLDLKQIKCEHPQVIFNRAVVSYIVDNGCVLCGKHINFDCIEDETLINFPYDKFNPWKNGIIYKWTQQPVDCVYKLNEWNFNNSYTWDYNGKQVDLFLAVPCGKCVACHSHKADKLANRLKLEAISHSAPPLFITLTYDNKHLPADGVQKHEIQCFFKRLRNEFPGVELRYFLASEYGSLRKRPHYHMILFNAPVASYDNISIVKFHNALCRCWCDDLRNHSKDVQIRHYSATSLRYYKSQKGSIDMRITDGKKMLYKYVSKYMNKQLNKSLPGKNDTFVLRSQGLGRSILSEKLKDDFIRSMGDVEVFNPFTAQSEPLQIDSYLLRKICPSPIQIVPLEIRNKIHLIPSYLRTLAQCGYPYTNQLSEKFNSLLSPFRKIRTLCIPDIHHYKVERVDNVGDNFRLNAMKTNVDLVIRMNNPMLDALLNLKFIYRDLSNFFKDLDPQRLMFNLRWRHAYFEKLKNVNKTDINIFLDFVKKNNAIFVAKRKTSQDIQ